MQISDEHLKTITEALQINRALITMSAAWDEHKGAQVVAINAALAALDLSRRQWGKCYCGCDACKHCEQLLEPEAEFSYRISPTDPRLVERRHNKRGARWFFWLRRDTPNEAKAALLQLQPTTGPGEADTP